MHPKAGHPSWTARAVSGDACRLPVPVAVTRSTLRLLCAVPAAPGDGDVFDTIKAGNVIAAVSETFGPHAMRPTGL
jgi:hypothetical protein